MYIYVWHIQGCLRGGRLVLAVAVAAAGATRAQSTSNFDFVATTFGACSAAGAPAAVWKLAAAAAAAAAVAAAVNNSQEKLTAAQPAFPHHQRPQPNLLPLVASMDGCSPLHGLSSLR